MVRRAALAPEEDETTGAGEIGPAFGVDDDAAVCPVDVLLAGAALDAALASVLGADEDASFCRVDVLLAVALRATVASGLAASPDEEPVSDGLASVFTAPSRVAARRRASAAAA